jgi:hypothetical protein
MLTRIDAAAGFERTAGDNSDHCDDISPQAGLVGRASTWWLIGLYLNKESNDVPSPQAQRSNSQTPIIANIASVIAAS